MTDTPGQVGAALLGACVGSFLNVVIWRLPRGTFLSAGRRSVCPACGAHIPWFRNLPVVSWMLLRGKAACCNARIAVRYPVVEILTAALFWLLAAHPPSGLAAWPPGVGSAVFVLHATFIAFLVASSFIDIDWQILPDRLTKPAMALGVLGAALLPEAYPQAAASIPIRGLPAGGHAVLFSAAGLGAGFGLIWLIRAVASWLFRKEAMGRGDIKFMGAIGAFVGWENVLVTFFAGCTFGAVGGLVHRAVTGQAYICFGPFLAAGALVAFFYGEQARVFFLETWPRWQESHPVAPLILVAVASTVLLFLLFLARRRRSP